MKTMKAPDVPNSYMENAHTINNQNRDLGAKENRFVVFNSKTSKYFRRYEFACFSS